MNHEPVKIDPKTPYDTNVRLPKSVQDQIDRANAAYKQPDAPSAPTKQEAAPPVPQPEPPKLPTPPGTEEPPPADTAPVSPQEWENRYKSMYGRVQKFQTETELLKKQNQELAHRLMEEQNRIASVQAQQPVERPVYITPEEEKSWGAEYVDMVRRAAKEIVEPEVKRLNQQQQVVQQQIVQSKTEKVYDALDREVPDWATVNHSPEFARWLDLPDPLSGAIRRGMLNNAMRAADAPRVARFFKSFASEATGSPVPQAATSALQQPAPYVDLRSIAAPDRAGSGTTQSHVPPEKPIITRAQIKQFYSDAGRRSYVGREADRIRDEAILSAAVAEGRVR